MIDYLINLNNSNTIVTFYSHKVRSNDQSVMEFAEKRIVVTTRRIISREYKTPGEGGGGGTTQPLPRDGGAEFLRGDPTVGPHPKVWTIGQE